MALLPGEVFAIQQIDGEVVLFRVDSEEEIVRFNPTDAYATARAQKTIHDSDALDAEQKCVLYPWHTISRLEWF